MRCNSPSRHLQRIRPNQWLHMQCRPLPLVMIVVLMTAAPTLSVAAATVTAEFMPSGAYEVRRDGEVVLKSAASPCGVHTNGAWCQCVTEGGSGAGVDGCALKLAGRTSGTGTDAIGRFNRTELQWSDEKGTVILVTAMRVYDRDEV